MEVVTDAGRTAKVLVADDDDSFRTTLKRFLTLGGYTVHAVANAAETLVALRQDVFDLLIADIQMPGNSRLELIREVASVAPGLPVIVMTGQPTIDSAASSVQLSVSAYLMKPPNLEELLSLVRRATDNYRVYRSLRDQWKRMEVLTQDAASRIAEMNTAEVSEATRESVARLKQVLAEFQRVGVGADTAAVHQLARHAELVQALSQTIQVLRQTKQAFRSPQLGNLRKQLEEIMLGSGSPSTT